MQQSSLHVNKIFKYLYILTYEEAQKFMLNNLKIVETNGNDKFPYRIHKLLIMPTDISHEDESCIIKWTVGNDIDFKKAFDICELSQDNFEVYVYTKEQMIRPILLSHYIS